MTVVKPTGERSDGEAMARLFHDTYERMAPDFGYETRPDTKQFDPQSKNGKLMIAVCGEVTASVRAKLQAAEKDAEKSSALIKRLVRVGMDAGYTKEWCLNMAQLEADGDDAALAQTKGEGE